MQILQEKLFLEACDRMSISTRVIPRREAGLYLRPSCLPTGLSRGQARRLTTVHRHRLVGGATSRTRMPGGVRRVSPGLTLRAAPGGTGGREMRRKLRRLAAGPGPKRPRQRLRPASCYSTRSSSAGRNEMGGMKSSSSSDDGSMVRRDGGTILPGIHASVML